MRYTILFVFIFLCAWSPIFADDKPNELTYGATAVCDGRTKLVTQTFSVPVAEEKDVTRKKDGIKCRSRLCKDILNQVNRVEGIIGPHLGEGTFYTLVYFVTNEPNANIDELVDRVAHVVAGVLAKHRKLKRVEGELKVLLDSKNLHEKGCGLTQAANPDPENFVEATPPDDVTIKSARPKLKKGPESGDPNPDQFAIEGEAPGKPKNNAGEPQKTQPPAAANVCAKIKQLAFRKRVFTRTHDYRSVHPEISEFQQFLVEVGLLQIEPGVDKFGRLGDKTALIIRAFQKCHGFSDDKQTGELDVATITKIFGGFAPKTLRRK